MNLFDKIKKNYFNFINRIIFRKVNCDFDTLVLGSEFYSNFVIKYPEKLSIGSYSVLNGDCMINAMGTIKIGNYCHIAKGLTIYSHNHNFRSDKSIPYDEEVVLKTVEIGNAVWIGANVTISPGSKIGHGVIISTGSVVFGNIEDCAIVRGNPAVIIGYRNKETFWKLYEKGRFF